MYLVTIISWIILAVWCTVRQSELVNVQNGQIFKLLKIRIANTDLDFCTIFDLHRQVCFHVLAPLHTEILKPSCHQLFVEVTFGVDVNVKLFWLQLQIKK